MAKNSIKRVTILNRCFSSFHQMLQWGMSANGIEYRNKAEVLIELLEVDDCGSIGGFDTSNPVVRVTPDTIYNRFLTVVRKYGDESKIEPICGFSLDDVTCSFIDLPSDLRKKSPNV